MPSAAIGISAAFIIPGQVGGAEQALYALIEGMDAVVDLERRIDIFAPPELPDVAFATSRSKRLRVRTLPQWPRNRFVRDTVAMLQAREHAAMLFPNYFTPVGRSGLRKVTVINDLQYLHYPENFSVRKRLWLRAAHELTLRSAHATVAISEFVRSDILRVFGSRFESRVHVVPWPIQWKLFESAGSPDLATLKWLDKRPFVLSVAAHYRHKNIETLVKAFARVRQLRPDVLLVLVGQHARELVGVIQASPIDELLRELALQDHVLVTGFVDEGQIGWFYRNAAMFAFPSLFEGMGRPAVEALGMGLPVVTTRRTAIPEMTQGLAAYVDDPLDPDELSSWIVRVVDSRSDFVPPVDHIARLRRAFAPETIGRAFCRLLLQ